MKNKKSIMAFSGLMILTFHLWVYIGDRNPMEMFFKLTAGIGVDIFFFLSAYSLAGRDFSDYREFLRSRFYSVYLKFFLFSVTAAIIVRWKISLFLKTVSGFDLLKRGGGSFLWFLPAIMILYILFPLYQKADRKNRWKTIGIFFVIWCAGAWAGTLIGFFHPLFIFWNRIPVFLLGYYSAVLPGMNRIWENRKLRIVCGLLLTVAGYLLIYLFGYHSKLHVPFYDMFYIVYIPAAIGWILLVGMLPECRVIKRIGSATLEMYGVQMVFGYKFANHILIATRSKGLTNLAVFVFVITISVILSMIYDKIRLVVRNISIKEF